MTGFTSAEWDITDPAAARDLIEPGDVLINCAAFTDVDGAEANPERARAVNAAGPEHLATACAAVGARLIHISTDYVFGGAPGRDRPMNPTISPRRCRSTAGPSSTVNAPCWRPARRPGLSALPGFIPATTAAATSSR